MEIPQFITNPDPTVYLSNNYLVLDFETSTVWKGSPLAKENRVVLACWMRPGGKLKFSFGPDFSDLLEDIRQVDFVVAHNAKFEFGWLKRLGLDIGEHLPFCTQIAEHVIRGNRVTQMPVGLNDCLERRGLPTKDDVVSRLIKEGVCPSEIPRDLLLKYCAIDVVRTHQLFLKQRKEIEEAGQLAITFTRCIATPVLADIESRGLYLDGERVKQVYQVLKSKQSKLLERWERIGKGFNPRSSPQRVAFLQRLGFKLPVYKHGRPLVTSKGFPKTDKETLKLMRPSTPEQKEFLDVYTQLAKVNSDLSKNIAKFHEIAEESPDDPIMYAALNQTFAQTHRLTSTGVSKSIQMQNLPKEYRPLFTAREKGWLILEADYRQLEYRVAVWLAQDEAGMSDIENDVDIHAYTASIIYRDKWGSEALSAAQREHIRFLAKSHTFKPLYGGSSGTEAEKRYYRAFKEKHKQIAAMQEAWKREVLSSGRLKLPTGLRFYWPAKIQPSGYVTYTTQICDYPVQCIATADIVPIGVVLLWHEMRAKSLKSFLTNTVHDSVMAEISPDERNFFEKKLSNCLVTKVIRYLEVVFGLDFNVPLEIEYDFKSHWKTNQEWEEKWLQK